MTKPEHIVDGISVDQLTRMFGDWPHNVYALNAAATYVFQNKKDRAEFGDLIGQHADFVTDDIANEENWANMHERVLAGEVVERHHLVGGGDEPARDIHGILTPVIEDGTVIGILGMGIDRSEAANYEREITASTELAQSTAARLERLTNNLSGGVFEFVLTPDHHMSFPYVSSGMGPLMGTTNEALLNDAGAAFLYNHPDDATLVNDAVMHSFETLEAFNLTHRIIHPDLGLRWHRISSTPTRRDDDSVIWHGSIFDVTEEWARAHELEDARNRMEALSLIDALTGLPNRRAYDDMMARRAKDRKAAAGACAVIRIDLDHFKSVNDTLGHAAGDAVLCRVAGFLGAVTSERDFAARLGGDEFVVVLAPGRAQSDAEDLIAALRAKIREPFDFEGRRCHFDASFGVASAETLPDDYTELLSSADAALLQAKHLGRGRSAIFTAQLQKEITHRRHRAAQIRDALGRDEFFPVFQPQIDAQSGKISGFEVLARWRHPVEGIVPPIEFIPVAEQMHVVQDIDRIMFEKALVAIDRMQHGGLDIPKVSFNVSAARVSDPEIIASVQRLQTNGTKVAFELLESILLEEETAVFSHHIDVLKDLGVDIEVDDFGSGRASVIGVLKVLPSTLKIDGRLIQPMFTNKASMGLLRAIIDIGLSLDINVTAEGVETMDHAVSLRAMGVHTLQGYVFGRPMPEEVLTTYLSHFRPVFDVGAAPLQFTG